VCQAGDKLSMVHVVYGLPSVSHFDGRHKFLAILVVCVEAPTQYIHKTPMLYLNAYTKYNKIEGMRDTL